MHLVLINPGKGRLIQPPLGLAYLAAYLKKYSSMNLTILDENVGDDLNSLKEINPDIVGISVTTPFFPRSIEIAKFIKRNLSIPIIAGGVHVTALPKNVMDNHLFDIGIIGEGEETLLELMNLYEKTKRFETRYLKKIKGIIFRDATNQIQITKNRPHIQNLDTIPLPSRDLLKMNEFYCKPRSVVRGVIRRSTQIITSRGCLFNCAYCANKLLYNCQVRFHSPEYVLTEIKYLLNEYNIEALFIQDDLFCANNNRLTQICKLLKEERLNNRFIWSCQLHSNLIDEDIIKTLKSAGCIQVEFGFESASPRILALLKNNTVTVQQNQKAIDLCYKHGLRILGNFIIGSPKESIKDIELTLQFIQKNKDKLDYISLHTLTPYPGTMIWSDLQSKKLINENNVDWKLFRMGSPNKGIIVAADNIKPNELTYLYKKIEKVVDEINFSKFDIHLKDFILNINNLKRALLRPTTTLIYSYKYLLNRYFKK